MGLAKQRMMELSEHLEGSDGQVALGGGYLYIYKNDKLIHIASIPSPNLLADHSSDSIVDNVDEFEDESGNQFEIAIYSSMTGIEWYLEKYPEDEELLMGMHYEIRLNED